MNAIHLFQKRKTQRHMKIHFPGTDRLSRTSCPVLECQTGSFNSYSQLRVHIEGTHNVNIKKEARKFRNEDGW